MLHVSNTCVGLLRSTFYCFGKIDFIIDSIGLRFLKLVCYEALSKLELDALRKWDEMRLLMKL